MLLLLVHMKITEAYSYLQPATLGKQLIIYFVKCFN